MVGISVSHQILRHWTATEPYLDILARFCQLAVRQWRASVILFPNEINRPGERNDTTVALHIKERARLGDRLRIFPAEQFTAGEQKAAIGNCSLLVASRYHSVVAALSSGVPTVVVGWHHKYRELLEHYGQAQFCLSASDCSTERLWQLAGGCWVRRQELHDQIEKNHAAVVRRIYTGAEELRSVVPIR